MNCRGFQLRCEAQDGQRWIADESGMEVRAVTQGVVPGGPVFVSYRQSDGKTSVTELAWLLRAAGIPVWHDLTDLPPGETEQRLEEALAAGLSGAVLLVTPEIAKSSIVQQVELPALLDLYKDPEFALAVASTIRKPDGKFDYGAPDDVLNQPRTLAAFKQYAADSRTELVELARQMANYRASRIAAAGRAPTVPLHIGVQTRGRPITLLPGAADLSITLRSGQSGRLPDAEGLRDLQSTLPFLSDTFRQTGSKTVRVTGGAHLSLAYAIGAALPATLVGALTVEGTDGEAWSCGTVSAGVDNGLVQRVAYGMNAAKAPGEPHAVVAFVELLPGRSEAAYTRLLSERNDFDAWEYLRPAAPGPLDPATAGALIEAVADHLRRLAQRHNNATLHLLLRCPFPVAVLLGRLCNTMRTVLYEWDDTELPADPDHRPRYVPVAAVRAGSATGPITDVLLAAPTSAGATA